MIENLQKTFTKKFAGLNNMTYWERLEILGLYSQERRLERYRVIYTWKSLEGLVPDCGLSSHYSARRGRYAAIKPLVSSSTAKTKSIRDGAFTVHGPKLFNSLPATIRNLTNCSVDSFKRQLDEYLNCLPDEPSCDNLYPGAINPITGRHSNSIIDQALKHFRP